MNLKSVIIYSFLGLFIHLHAYAIELSDSNLEMLKNQAKKSVEDLNLASNEYHIGFVEALSEFDSLPMTYEKINEFLPYYHLKAMHSLNAVDSRISGKLSAYKLMKIVYVRSESGAEIMTKEQAKPITDRLVDLETKMNRLIDQRLSSYDEKFGEIVDEVKSKIAIQIRRDKRALVDPTYITAPVFFNDFSKSNIISKFDEAINELLDFNKLASELNKKYGYFIAAEFYTKDFQIVTRIKVLPEFFRELCFQYIDTYSIKQFNRNDKEMLRIETLIQAVEMQFNESTDAKIQKPIVSELAIKINENL